MNRSSCLLLSVELRFNLNSSTFRSILKQNKLFKFANSKLLKSEGVDLELISIIESYFQSYIDYNQLTDAEVLNYYNNFVQNYSEDLENYRKHGKYPFELKITRSVSRVEYDIALIISILLSPVRYQIISNLYNDAKQYKGRSIVIGIGSGIDLEVICKSKEGLSDIEAYDIELNPFIKHYFGDTGAIHVANFEGVSGEKADRIIAIELLEHLEDPYGFIELVSSSLKGGGEFVFTTATAMPQYDHLYDFSSDVEVEKRLNKFGLHVKTKKDYFHHYLKGPEASRNTWYVAIKE